MFEVSGRMIRISRGDTGMISFETDLELTENDRAVFTVKRRSGGMVMQKVIALEDGKILLPFVSSDTEKLRPDTYEWDIRFVIDAVEDEDGEVTDGREVLTPFAPGTMMIVRTVGDV